MLNTKNLLKCFVQYHKITKKYGIERQCHLDSTYRSIFQDFKMWQRNLRDNEFSSSFLRAKPKKTKSPRDADFVCRCEALLFSFLPSPLSFLLLLSFVCLPSLCSFFISSALAMDRCKFRPLPRPARKFSSFLVPPSLCLSLCPLYNSHPYILVCLSCRSHKLHASVVKSIQFFRKSILCS